MSFEPRTETQRLYHQALSNHNMTIAIGPAGTSKTYCAVTYACQYLPKKALILSRPNVGGGVHQIGADLI